MPPALDSLVTDLAAPSLSSLRRWAEVLLTLLIAVQLARLGVILLRPDVSVDAARTAARPADSTILGRFDPFNRTDVVAASNAAAPQLRLFGVRSGPNGGAIIAGTDGVQNSYGVGQEVQPGLVLTQVQGDHVVLSRGGLGSRLYFDKQAPSETPRALAPPPPPEPEPAPPSASPARGGIDLGKLGQEMGLKPVEGGGFVVAPSGGGSVVMALAGLRAGDVITAVDGKPLSAAAAGNPAAQFAGRSSAQITFVRDGETRTVTLQVPRR